MLNKIFAHGQVEIVVAVNDILSVFSYSPCKIYVQAATPNRPPTWGLLAETVAGVEYNSAAFTVASNVRIEGGADYAVYATGTLPQTSPGSVIKQGAPAAETTDVTLTAAELLGKLITGTHAVGATQTYTLPTGALLDAAAQMEIGEAFDWHLINLSAAAADSITVAAGNAHTVVGMMIVASIHATTGGLTGGSSGHFRTRKTAAGTFVTYRIG